mmetsp:Transcript_24567/g.97488  ORF Transcript_24567/g.97488 Transcript_24567/m.97488 type:complete len:225 (+) Transcript_24567:108-782(+)
MQALASWGLPRALGDVLAATGAARDEELGATDDDDDDDTDDDNVFGEKALDSVVGWARGLYGAVDETVAGAEDQLRASLAALPSLHSPAWLSRRTHDLGASAAATLEASRRLRIFAAWLLVSAAFFALAFFVGLPVLALRPQKFALCFTLGSLAFMGSFAALRGIRAHLRVLCARERAAFTAAYAATMLATLHAAVVRRSFVLTILASTAQFTTPRLAASANLW